MKKAFAFFVLAFSASLVLAVLALVFGWSDHYAFAVRNGNDWALSTGLGAGFLVLLAGVVAGGTAVGGLGLLAGAKLWQSDAECGAERVAELIGQLESERKNAQVQIEIARKEGMESGRERVYHSEQNRKLAEDRAQRLEGRLKGAQGKANRKAKQANGVASVDPAIGNFFKTMGNKHG